MGRFLNYISFFEEFAKAHLDIAHLSAIDYPIPAARSTQQATLNNIRFKATHMERVMNALANNSDAKYKAFMFVDAYDFHPLNRNGNTEFSYIQINGTVTIVQEAEEENIAEENNRLDTCEAAIEDLIAYMKQMADYTNSTSCHPLLQHAEITSMKATPDFNLLDTNSHGYTLDFSIVQFRPSGIRSGKFRPNFLPGVLQTTPSPLTFAPSTATAGDTLTISGPNLEGTQEVRFCPVPLISENCVRLGTSTFSYVGANIDVVIPVLPIGQYTIELKTELGSWVANGSLQVL